MVAVVTVALIGLARSALRSPLLAAIGIGALALSALGTHELMVLLLAGAAVLLVREGHRLVGAGAVFVPALGPLALAAPVGTATLFLYFLKVGAVLYGSGYVLLAFLRADLVDRSGWLTEAQLLDAVAIGQITPGPVFTTATFVGYLLDGIPGGLAATCGIFLPAFLLAGLSGRLVAWIRSSPVAGSFLDGVIVGSLALMAVVTWRLGRVAIDGPLAAGVLLLSLGLLRLGVNSARVLLAGATSGALLTH